MLDQDHQFTSFFVLSVIVKKLDFLFIFFHFRINWPIDSKYLLKMFFAVSTMMKSIPFFMIDTKNRWLQKSYGLFVSVKSDFTSDRKCQHRVCMAAIELCARTGKEVWPIISKKNVIRFFSRIRSLWIIHVFQESVHQIRSKIPLIFKSEKLLSTMAASNRESSRNKNVPCLNFWHERDCPRFLHRV
jgi:hypothetical protein